MAGPFWLFSDHTKEEKKKPRLSKTHTMNGRCELFFYFLLFFFPFSEVHHRANEEISEAGFVHFVFAWLTCFFVVLF